MTEEQKTIEKVLQGDAQAFEELVIANEKIVYNLAMKMTGNVEDAQDITQEVFIKTYRQLAKFRGESKFSVWLYKMTYNLAIDYIRKRGRSAKTIPLTYPDEDSTPLDLPSLDELPEESILREELRRNIDDCIETLSEDHRAVFTMREVAGLSYAEIAESLAVSEGTVKSRLARARQNLVKGLTAKGTFPSGYRQNS
ncbi:MAG: sigma-70 family RNA polymerase sigma factor [Oscillospiraceae bacterium]|nr:sigma-70 family RNA polymerase sigma factor [Oscillospiraceae bacterium]